jgi:hypothetical protein
VPTLFPHTYYDLRYGLEMLPGVAVFSSFLLGPSLRPARRWILLAGAAIIVLGQAAGMLARGVNELPLVKESLLNTPCHSARQQALIRELRARYDGQPVLLAAGKWPCLLPELGIPFRRTVSESNRAQWLRMKTEPASLVEWIVRGDGDSVDQMMRAYPGAFAHFQAVVQMNFPHEGELTLYRRRP